MDVLDTIFIISCLLMIGAVLGVMLGAEKFQNNRFRQMNEIDRSEKKLDGSNKDKGDIE